MSSELQALLFMRIGAELRERQLGQRVEPLDSFKRLRLEDQVALLNINTVLEISSAIIKTDRSARASRFGTGISEERAQAIIVARVLVVERGALVEVAGGEAFGEARGYTASASSRSLGTISVSLTSREALERAALIRAIKNLFDGFQASAVP
ncbi:MAG: hypothetical protein ACK4NX_00090 [Candidatus Paceibacteria bacterium]